jgi:hypothetical protein
MRRSLLITLMMISGLTLFAQETLTGWTFPVNTGPDSLNANLGTTQNKTYDLRFQWALSPTNDSTLNTINFISGATTFAANTTGWDNGVDYKFWSIKFKANNYTDFKLSSKQYSPQNGPRDFKIQWRLSSGSYADVPNGNVTLGSDWTTGVLTNLPVPITNQGSSSIYIRWIMSSNTSVNGGAVASDGTSAIDDILVTGVGSMGQQEIIYTNRLKFSANPNHGNFTIYSTVPVQQMQILSLEGKVLAQYSLTSREIPVSLPNARPGLYLMKVKFGDSDWVTARFVVE